MDITDFKRFGEKLYLSPLLDVFNGEMITYILESGPVYTLVCNMLERSFEQLHDGNSLLIHSDQGWHYSMNSYRQALSSRGITQRMSRKGNCDDNSVMENFFGILKSEILYTQPFESIEHFKRELTVYFIR